MALCYLRVVCSRAFFWGGMRVAGWSHTRVLDVVRAMKVPLDVRKLLGVAGGVEGNALRHLVKNQ